MSAAKHTPGPWEPIKLNSAPLGLWAVNAPGYGGRNPLVCGMEYSKGGPILHAESEANARLIAAAPDLLEALKEMVAGDAEAIEEAQALGVPFPEEMLATFKKARAAIARATGETT